MFCYEDFFDVGDDIIGKLVMCYEIIDDFVVCGVIFFGFRVLLL